MVSDVVDVVTTTTTSSCISTRSERFEKEQLRVNRNRLQVVRERIRNNNHSQNNNNNTTSVVVVSGNSNSNSNSNNNNNNNSNNGNNKNKPHNVLQVKGGHNNKSTSSTSSSNTIVKYSRIVYLLTFVLVVCGAFLLLSPIFLVPSSSAQSSTQTISSVLVHDDRSNNKFFEPPIISNNKNDNNHNYVNDIVVASSFSSANREGDDSSHNSFYHVPPEDNTHHVQQSLSWETLNQHSIYQKSRTQQPPQHIPTHLPLPIFVMNMPKSGSTTIHAYFRCGMGKLYSLHHAYNKQLMDPREVDHIHPDMHTAATCMGHNYLMDKPLIQGCGGFPVWTDAGAVVWDIKGDEHIVLDSHYNNDDSTTDTKNQPMITKQENNEKKHRSWCFFPGVHALENIAKYYPYATILHLPRNSTDWVRSSTGWSKSMAFLGTNSSSQYEAAVNDRKNRNSHINDTTTTTTTTQKKEKWGGKTILDRYEIKCHGFDPNEGIGPPMMNRTRRRGEEEEIAAGMMNVEREGGEEQETFRTGHHNNNTTTASPKKKKKKIHIQKTDTEWMAWYETNYTQRIREFAINHPTLTYFESKLDDPHTPTRLEQATGIAASCFGHNLKTADRLVQWKEKNTKDQNTNQKNTDTPPKRAKARKK